MHEDCFPCGITRLLVSVCIAVAVLVVCPESGRADQATDDYKLAIGLYNRKRWENAASAFDQFLKRHAGNPRAPVARLYYGSTLARLERHADARTQYQEFIQRYPKNENLAIAMFRAGECSYLLGEHETARRDLKKFLDRFSGNEMEHWALSYLGTSQLQLKAPQDARKTFERLIARHKDSPTLPDARFGLADALSQLGEKNAALKAFQRIAADPKDPNAANSLTRIGDIQFQSDRFADAAATYERLGQQFPNSKLASSARLNAGISWFHHGDFQKAIVRLNAVSSEPAYAARAGLLIGRSQMRIGNYPAAIAAFDQAYNQSKDDPLAEEILFRRADCDRLQEKHEAAADKYLAAVGRWPAGTFADDSLYYASESDLTSGNLDRAEQSLARLTKDFADSTLRYRAAMLRGRVLAKRGDKNNLESAVTEFNKSVNQKTDAFAANAGRYYLSRTLQRLDRHEDALSAAAPLLQRVERGELPEYAEVLVMAASSSLNLKKFDDAVRLTTTFFEVDSKPGARAIDALTTRAVANAELGRQQASDADLQALEQRNPGSEKLDDVRMRVAETAWGSGKFEWSASLFAGIARGKSEHRARAMSGLGWSYLDLKRYDDSARAFDEFLRNFPQHKLAAESAFLKGESWRRANKTAESAKAFAQAFGKYAPASPSPKGAEKKGQPHFFAFESGRAAAMAYEQLGDVERADAVWKQLVDLFPQAEAKDELLDHWAWLNLDAGRDARSDEIFTRLVAEHPESPRADNAQLSLAESALIAERIDEAKIAFTALQSSSRADPEVQEASLFHLIGIAVDAEDWKEVETLSTQFLERFSSSTLAPRVTLHNGEARFSLDDPKQTVSLLDPLRKKLVAQPVDDEWADRVWVVLADAYLQLKEYDQCRSSADELGRLRPQSAYLYQAREIAGRSYKTEAPPQFAKARGLLQQVVDDPHGRRTVTAAKAQFLIADTWLLERNHARALDAFLRVYIQYKFPDWQAPALFQVGRCEEALQKTKDALRSYEDLVAEFPDSEWAAKAKQRLQEIRGSSR